MPVQRGAVLAVAGVAALLGGLHAAVGLTAAAWVVGLAVAVVLAALVVRSAAAHGVDRLSGADLVTLFRAVLVAGVTALVEAGLEYRPVTLALAVTAAVALALDAVDGRVARHTGTARAFGARFDMETDAFLILVLAVDAAVGVGAWVLAIGLFRYAFVGASWFLGWLRGESPPRPWAKVVAAVQGVALTVVASGLLPHVAAVVLLAVSLALLTESFGRQVAWLWVHRPAPSRRRVRPRTRPLVVGVLAVVAVWAALAVAADPGGVTVWTFVRVPAELLALVLVALVLPRPGRRVVAAVVGALIGLVLVTGVLDAGFRAALDRPFDVTVDWAYAGSAVGLLADSIGHTAAVLVVVAGVVVLAVVVVVAAMATVRVAELAAAHRRGSLRAVTALGLVWALLAAFDVQVAGAPGAAAGGVAVASEQVRLAAADRRDAQTFGAAVTNDAYRNVPGDQLLTGLRGKDVLVVFVESYGRVAVQDSFFSPGVDAVLESGTQQLAASGWAAQSAFLTSPTFGGISWLAHSTVQTGLWIDSQPRYDQVVAGDRFTLSDAFNRAGWRTVDDIPSNTKDWPEGRDFYHYDQVWDDRNTGYTGPKFGYAQMPDQYTLAAFQQRELQPGHAPVFGEIDLVSSHTPWTPTPEMVPWDQLGDGSVFDPMPAQLPSADQVWPNPHAVQAAYGQSIEYTMTALTSWLQQVDDPNLVLLVMGDHQPASIVSGTNPSHDVPVSIISRDPAVFSAVADWHWQAGLLPSPSAPVWRMDTVRDRFLGAFGPSA